MPTLWHTTHIRGEKSHSDETGCFVACHLCVYMGRYVEVVSAMYFISSLHITVSRNTEFLVSSTVFLFALATPMAIACTGHLKFIMTLPNGSTFFLYNFGVMALITFISSKELMDIDSFYLTLTATIVLFFHIVLMRLVYPAIEKAISRLLTESYFTFLTSHITLTFISANNMFYYKRHKAAYNKFGKI